MRGGREGREVGQQQQQQGLTERMQVVGDASQVLIGCVQVCQDDIVCWYVCSARGRPRAVLHVRSQCGAHIMLISKLLIHSTVTVQVTIAAQFTHLCLGLGLCLGLCSSLQGGGYVWQDPKVHCVVNHTSLARLIMAMNIKKHSGAANACLRYL